MSELMEPQEQERWELDSDQKADWAMQEIARLEKDTQKWEDFYARKAEIVREQNSFRINQLRSALYGYWQTQPHKGKSESYALPSGKLLVRKQQPEYRKEEKDLMLWVSTNAKQYVKKTEVETVAWSDLKKNCDRVGDTLVLKDTGEIVKGVTVVDREPVFEVKRYDGGVTAEEEEE